MRDEARRLSGETARPQHQHTQDHNTLRCCHCSRHNALFAASSRRQDDQYTVYALPQLQLCQDRQSSSHNTTGTLATHLDGTLHNTLHLP